MAVGGLTNVIGASLWFFFFFFSESYWQFYESYSEHLYAFVAPNFFLTHWEGSTAKVVAHWEGSTAKVVAEMILSWK